jgi:hypothetical protein
MSQKQIKIDFSKEIVGFSGEKNRIPIPGAIPVQTEEGYEVESKYQTLADVVCSLLNGCNVKSMQDMTALNVLVSKINGFQPAMLTENEYRIVEDSILTQTAPFVRTLLEVYENFNGTAGSECE